MGVFIDAGWTAAIADDAAFRDKVARIRAALIAAGATRVTGLNVGAGAVLPDDLSAITKPTVANVAAGFDVWRFNDDKHNTGGKKGFLRLHYGTGTSGAAVLGLWAQASTDIDAAGGIPVGAYSGEQHRIAYSSAPTQGGFYASCDLDRITFFTGLQASSNGWSFNFERALEADGTPTDFLFTCGTVWGGNDFSQVIRYDGPASARNSGGGLNWIQGATHTYTGGWSSMGSDRLVSPGFVMAGAWKFMRVCHGRSADFVQGTIYSFEYLGKVRSFICVAHFSSANQGILAPWE